MMVAGAGRSRPSWRRCDEITREDRLGDVLVFLPGEREIRDVHQALERRKYRETEVLPLYARLSARDQDRVFNPGPKRRLVLATNVAETSLTVPRIRYVIDPGTARVKRYSPRAKLDRLHIEAISQASADQRKGRCGRIAAGVCYRLYAEADFQSRPRYTDPEILRASAGRRDPADAGAGSRAGRGVSLSRNPRRTRASPMAGRYCRNWARSTTERRLTPIGRTMARLPVDVKLARMLIAAREHGALREVLAIAAFLGIQDPRERPPEQRQAADTAHALFADPKSEFIGIVKLWEAYRDAHEELTQSKLRDWCGKHFLGFLRMREWRELHRQLLLLCEELGWSQNAASADYGALHRALIAGLPTQVGYKTDKGVFEGPRGRKYALFPGSALAKQPPPWVLSALLLDTQKVWALTNARIEPDWIIAELPHLLARKHFDPHWSRAQGTRDRIGTDFSLFGLVLAPKRPVHYGGLYPQESREIFVRQALVPGEINTQAGFLPRNLATLEQAREEEAKLRRAGLVADEDWQARWYLDRIPVEINTAAALDNAGFAALAPAAQRALQWSLPDLLPGEGSEADRFPKLFALGDARLALHYRFEPGRPDDGVTLEVPLHLLGALDAARLSWLVPGLVEEKATALIRALPKALRRNFVPAPDFARAFAEAWAVPGADTLHGELARFLARATGVAVAGTDFDEAALDPHLRMNLRLLGPDRRALGESRDLPDLRARYGERAEQAFARRAGKELAAEGLRDFPREPIPATVPGEAGLPAFPALVDTGDSVALRVFADGAQAAAEHPRGVRRLLELALADKAKQAAKQLPVSPKTGLLYAAIESQERLRGDLVGAAMNALLAEGLDAVRDHAAFDARRADAGRRLFAEAMQRLALAEEILALVAPLRAQLDPPLMGWARANLDDLREQLNGLIHPGFLRGTAADALAQYPRYLNAMLKRAERLLRDPARDQARMLELRPFTEALDAARKAGAAGSPAWEALRWDLEELRVSMFAQELGTRGPVSAKRLAQRLEALRRSASTTSRG
jgi:ATP-dependent helicase HrpA